MLDPQILRALRIQSVVVNVIHQLAYAAFLGIRYAFDTPLRKFLSLVAVIEPVDKLQDGFKMLALFHFGRDHYPVLESVAGHQLACRAAGNRDFADRILAFAQRFVHIIAMLDHGLGVAVNDEGFAGHELLHGLIVIL